MQENQGNQIVRNIIQGEGHKHKFKAITWMKSSKRWKKTLDEYKRTENCNKNNILWIERWLKYNDKEEEAGAQSYSIAVLLVREKKIKWQILKDMDYQRPQEFLADYWIWQLIKKKDSSWGKDEETRLGMAFQKERKCNYFETLIPTTWQNFDSHI